MGRYLSPDPSAGATAATGELNRSLTIGPASAGRAETMVVPAGVDTVYVTGCAQGGTSFSGAPSGGVGSGNLVFDGESYLLTNGADYSAGTSREAFNRTGKNNFSGVGSLLGQYLGMATGASASGDPFIVSGGTTGNNGVSGISWSTDGGYSFSLRTVTSLYTAACAKQVAVSDDGRAVVLWSQASGAQIALSATKDYGATWVDITATQLGDGTLDPGTIRFIDDVFIIGVSGGGKYRYATDPTGAWAAITTGQTGNGCDVAWDGATYVWASSSGELRTSTTLTGTCTARTSGLPNAATYLAAGAAGNFVAHSVAAASNSVGYSTDGGVTWTNATPSAVANYKNGNLVYSPDLGIFVLQSDNASYSHRSATGASWTALSSATGIQGRPTSYNHTGYKILSPFPGGVLCSNVYLASATATAWTSSFSMAVVGYPTPGVDGVAMAITGSVSGSLLTLAGGKGSNTAAATAPGMDGGGTLLNGGRGASAPGVGGAGLDGVGGRSTTTSGDMSYLPSSPAAGCGRTDYAVPASGGGGTLPLVGGVPEGVRVPGAGGGYSTFSTNAYLGGGGGSMYARGGDARPATAGAATTVNTPAEGIGQGGYGVTNGSAVIAAAGGGEGCYRVPVQVVPGETLTITVPGRGSSNYSSASFTASSGGPGIAKIEWREAA